MRIYKDFEEYLYWVHARQYNGLDDGMAEDFEKWFEDLCCVELVIMANEWMKEEKYEGA